MPFDKYLLVIPSLLVLLISSLIYYNLLYKIAKLRNGFTNPRNDDSSIKEATTPYQSGCST